jgi:hypothetical protein
MKGGVTELAHLVDIAQRHLNAMLDEIRGELTPTTETPSAPAPLVTSTNAPISWRLIERRHDVTYAWPTLLEEYDPFDIYEGELVDGTTARYAIGHCERQRVWGRDRLYKIVFRLGRAGGSKQPICEFLEADDADDTHEFVAIVRGSGGPRGQRMFDPSEDLPELYSGLRIETYRDRIAGTPQFTGWNKLAVVANADDHESMLRHAFNQVQLRHLDTD